MQGVIKPHSTCTFFCSRECAAKWGDDQTLIQALAGREKQKKEKANPADD
jgi:hypothetical protein